jgi:hypothetical protein
VTVDCGTVQRLFVSSSYSDDDYDNSDDLTTTVHRMWNVQTK